METSLFVLSLPSPVDVAVTGESGAEQKEIQNCSMHHIHIDYIATSDVKRFQLPVDRIVFSGFHFVKLWELIEYS